MYLHAFASTRAVASTTTSSARTTTRPRAFDSASSIVEPPFLRLRVSVAYCKRNQWSAAEPLLLESSHIMSATALEALYTYIFQNIS